MTSKSIKPGILFSLLAFSIFFISSCSVWDDFTTYFNLYYNTTELFEKAEEEIKAQKQDLFSTEQLQIPATANQTLIKVIEKASDLLQFSSETAYVDDALMILGKAFYYQKNFQKSKRKFQELLATQKETDLTLETQLWIAKNNMQLREYSDGLDLLGKVRQQAITEEEEEILKETYVEEIRYRVGEEDYAQALTLADEYLKVSEDDEVNARIVFEMGKLYEKIDDIESAIASYKRVFDYSPDFDLETLAWITYGTALRESGQDSLAFSVFEDIRDNDKFIDSYGEIDLQTGITLINLERYDEAENIFRDVDTVYANTPQSGAAKYHLGNIFADFYNDLDSAAYFYQKASVSTLPKTYIADARSQNILFGKYLGLRVAIDKYDKQLYYAENPDAFAQDSIAYLQDSLQLLAQYTELKELQDIWSNIDTSFTLFPDTLSTLDSLALADSLRLQDSLWVVDSLRIVDSLKQFDPFALDTIFNTTKQKDPLTKGKEDPLLEGEGDLSGTEINPLDTIKFKNNPPRKPSIPVDSVRTILAKNRLELGNLFLTELNLPDSAYENYFDALDRFKETYYYPNLLYAMGSYYLTKNEKEKADSLFRIIYDNYKDRTIVNAAADKLKLPLIDLNYEPAQDLYASAETDLMEGNHNQSVSRFYDIYKSYPSSEFAPKALFTTGWILENELQLLDSAAIVYDTLVANYPTSEYVKNIAQKLSAYKQEQARKQKELVDSINALKEAGLDSLITDSLFAELEITDSTLSDSTTAVLEEFFAEDEEQQDDEIVALNDGANENNIKETEKVEENVKLNPLWNPRGHKRIKVGN